MGNHIRARLLAQELDAADRLRGNPRNPAAVFDALAAWGRVSRMTPDAERDRALSLLDAAIPREETLLKEALANFDADEWIRDAADMVRSRVKDAGEDPFSEVFSLREDERGRTADRLLESLDSVLLAAFAASRMLGRPPCQGTEAGIRRALEFLEARAVEFVDAVPRARELCEACERLDKLQERDFDLAETMAAMETVILAVETESESESERRNLVFGPPRDAGRGMEVARPRDPERKASSFRDLARRLECLAPVSLAAGVLTPAVASERLTWKPATGNWAAHMRVPLRAAEDERIPLFFHPPGGPAGERKECLRRILLGAKVYPVPDGIAQIPFKDIRTLADCGTPPVLVVESDAGEYKAFLSEG